MDIFVAFLTVSGLFFFITGTVGILRMPDALTRLHAATKCDTLGVLLVVGAVLLSEGFTAGSVKLLFVIAFLWVTSPTAAAAIAEAIAQDWSEPDLPTPDEPDDKQTFGKEEGHI